MVKSSAEKTAEELEHSRILDVHTWSEHKEVNQFVDQIHEQHFATHLSDIRKKHLKVILLDLYVAWLDDPTLCISVDLNVNRYLAGSRYNALNISKTTIKVIYTLEELGLIFLKKGFLKREEGGKSRVARIWPTEDLIEHFSEARFRHFEIQIH